MLYTAANARGATIIDVDTGERFSRVSEVSTSGGWIKVHDNPSRIDAQGRIAGRRIRFASIYAIQGLERMPCLFHCYGRQSAEAV